MGGPSQAEQNQQNQITQDQLNLSTQEFGLAKQNQALGLQLAQPAVMFNSELASGDPSKIMAAIAPSVTGITQGTSAAREQIMDQTLPGAGRDTALAQLPEQQASQIASLGSNAYLGSFNNLAQIGAGIEGTGLQQTGASISGANTASQSNQALMNIQEQSKASTLGFIGSLAGAAGEAAGGGAFGKICWIAEALYGPCDFRVQLIRDWLVGPFSKAWYGRLVVLIYRKTGRFIANIARRSRLLRFILKPLFNAAARRAMYG